MDRLFSRNASKFSSLVNEHCQVLKLKTIQMSMETFGIFFSALIVSLLAVNRFVLHLDLIPIKNQLPLAKSLRKRS